MTADTLPTLTPPQVEALCILADDNLATVPQERLGDLVAELPGLRAARLTMMAVGDAPADPSSMTPAVRAALRIMYADIPEPTSDQVEAAYDELCAWVQGWPQE